jgi:hypothetical protein
MAVRRQILKKSFKPKASHGRSIPIETFNLPAVGRQSLKFKLPLIGQRFAAIFCNIGRDSIMPDDVCGQHLDPRCRAKSHEAGVIASSNHARNESL